MGMDTTSHKRHSFASPATAAMAALLLSACAATVSVEPAHFMPLVAGATAPAMRLRSQVDVKLATGYTRVLPTGSQWRAVGSLTKGTVYQRVDGVFSIEGRHVHEAYLVVHRSALQGFYLPGEGNFSPLTPPVSLPLGEL
jgi:hypothetical protein